METVGNHVSFCTIQGNHQKPGFSSIHSSKAFIELYLETRQRGVGEGSHTGSIRSCVLLPVENAFPLHRRLPKCKTCHVG